MQGLEEQIEAVRAEIEAGQRKLADLESQRPDPVPRTKEEEAQAFADFVAAQAQIAIDRNEMITRATKAVADEIKARETPRRTRKEPAA